MSRKPGREAGVDTLLATVMKRAAERATKIDASVNTRPPLNCFGSAVLSSSRRLSFRGIQAALLTGNLM
jgi:hypothetical protein